MYQGPMALAGFRFVPFCAIYDMAVSGFWEPTEFTPGADETVKQKLALLGVTTSRPVHELKD